MDEYRFFRKDKPGWRGGELPLKVKEWECFPLGWLMSPVERICVKIKRAQLHCGRCLLQTS